MLYLPDEMFKQINQTIKICFGKPFSYKDIDKSKNYKEWADFFKKESYKMRDI
jgi:hypothetical protein